MATIPDSVKAQLDSDWTGAGGAEPTYYVEEDIRVNPPAGQDWVLILSSTLATDPVPVNDKYVNEKHILEMVVNTLTSEDRLKELGDEVVRILNATAITNITYQRLKRRKITSGIEKGVFNYQEVITYDLREQMKSSTAAYGSSPQSTFEVDELTVNTFITGLGLTITDFLDEDNMASDSAVALSSQQSIKAYADSVRFAHDDLTDTTLTGVYLEDLLMFGSANKAWVPCIVEWATNVQSTAWTLRNTGAANITILYRLPLPTVKGGLKLYITGLRVHVLDADADDYVDRVRVQHTTYFGSTEFIDEATNRVAQGEYDTAVGATDVSGSDNILVYLEGFNTDFADLDVVGVFLECYYAA